MEDWITSGFAINESAQLVCTLQISSIWHSDESADLQVSHLILNRDEGRSNLHLTVVLTKYSNYSYKNISSTH